MLIKKTKNIALSAFIMFLLYTQKASAGFVDCGKMENEGDKYNCGLNDLINTSVKIANWLLGIAGSLTLLMFVYGGIMLLISGGSSERVSKGKTILTNGAIGLVVVLLSFLIIGFVFKALGVDVSGTAWSKTGWFK